MKINEVVIREIDVKVEKKKTKGLTVELNSRKYQWTGQSWIDVTNAVRTSDGNLQGVKKVPKEIIDRLNGGFPDEPDQEPKKGTWPKDEPQSSQGGLPPVVMKNQVKNYFPNSGLVSLSNTDAANLNYKNVQVNNILLPHWRPKIRDALGLNKGMYMLYNKDRYILINQETPEGKKIATAIVRALLKEPDKPGLWSRFRDKMADLADPDDPTSAGYAALNQKGILGKPARGPISTILTKGAAKVDQAIGGAINKIKGKK